MTEKPTTCNRCGFQNPAGMRFCGGCGNPLAAAPVDEERKQVAILFADICDYTALVSSHDQEEIKEKIDACLRLIAEQVTNYDGVVDKFIGDAVMAVFGVPISHENDAERAVRAGMRILDQVRWYGASAGLNIHLRVGVHAGEVIVGVPTGEPGREHSVFGDTVNLAARIESTGEPDRVVVSAAVYNKTRAVFEYEKLSSVKVKGLAEELERYLLTGEQSVRGRVRGVRDLNAPLIGRDKELSLLTDAYAAAAQGLGARVVAVVGEPGIGKTRLTEELLKRLKTAGEEPLFLRGRCLGYAGVQSYLPFSNIIKGLADVREDTSVAETRKKLAALVASVFGENRLGQVDAVSVLAAVLSLQDEGNAPVNPEQLHEQVGLLLEELFRTLAKKRPIIILIEDIHWADSASLGVVEQLTRNLGPALALMILNSRPPDYGAETARLFERLAAFQHFRTVPLMDLTREQSSDLISALLAVERITPRTRELIAQKSGGNPFYVEEIIRLLIEEGVVIRTGDKWTVTHEVEGIEIPESVEEVIRSRVDHLPRQAKRVIQRAAVVGRIFWRQVVSDLMGQPVDEYLDEIERRDLIRRSDASSLEDDLEYIFKHSLLHESVYNGVLRRVRQELHLKTAVLIEESHADRLEPYLSLIAYHYEMGNSLPRAAEYYLRAGFQAAGLCANEDAKRFYSRAVACAKAGAILRRAYQGWGDVCARTGDNVEALEKYESARGYVDTAAEDAELLVRIGDVYERRSLYEKALDYYGRAGQLISAQTPTVVHALVSKGTAWVYYLRGEYDKAYPFARRAEFVLAGLADESPEADMARAWAYNVLGAILHARGEAAEARVCYERTLALYEKHGDLFGVGKTLNNIGTTALSQGNYGAAAADLRRSLEMAEKAGNRFGQAVACCNLGYMSITLGNAGDARSYFERYLAINQAIGNRLGDGYAYGGLAKLACERGDAAVAEDLYARSITVYNEVGAASLAAETWLELAACYAAAGFPDKAAAALAQSQIGGDSPSRIIVELSVIVASSSAALDASHDDVARRAEEEAEATGDAVSSLETYGLLARYHRARGDEAKAAAFAERANRLAGEVAATIPDHLRRERFMERLRKLELIT